MTKNENKTAATDKDPLDLIAEWVDDEQKRQDSLTLIEMIHKTPPAKGVST